MPSLVQPAGAFIPYASGPRGCVGRPFAGVALRILLARVCAALDFSPAASGAAAPAAAAAKAAVTGDPKETGVGVQGASATPPAEGPTEKRAGFRERQEASSGSAGGDVTPSGGASKEGWRETAVGGGEGGGGGIPGGGKEMQAGFTVLPGGGVHLRLRKWK